MAVQAAENGVDSTMAVLSTSIEQIPKDLVLSILGGSLDCGTLYLQVTAAGAWLLAELDDRINAPSN